MDKPSQSIKEAERFLNRGLANVMVASAVMSGIVESGRLLITLEDKRRLDDLAGKIYAAAFNMQVDVNKFSMVDFRKNSMAVQK